MISTVLKLRLIAPLGAVETTLGFGVMLNSFAAMIIGGFGSLSGVVIAGMMIGLLERLNREFKKTILMVTHDPHAAGYAERTVHLDKGQLGRIEKNDHAAV